MRLGEVARDRGRAGGGARRRLLDGERAVGIDIRKVSGANTVEVADGVRGAVDELKPELPAGVRLAIDPRQLGLDPRLGRGRPDTLVVARCSPC